MTDIKDETQGGYSPDRSTCRNCGEPIVWDDWCYIHPNGWADCGTTVTGGTSVQGSNLPDDWKAALLQAPPPQEGAVWVVDPEVTTPPNPTRAEPIEWNGPKPT